MTQQIHGAALPRIGAYSLSLAMLLSLIAMTPPVKAAAVITVNTTDQEVNGDADCSLQEAIYAANLDGSVAPDPANPANQIATGCAAGSGADTIFLAAGATYAMSRIVNDYDNYLGPTATPMVASNITIEGAGARLVRVPSGTDFRAFAVGQTGHLDLREVQVDGFTARGGDGAAGGGGGLGAGGAIFVQGGTLIVQWSSFQGNSATGGNGGHVTSDAAGGGGGGLSGDGGGVFVTAFAGGGGGGGARGNGGIGDVWPFGGGVGGGGGGTVGDGQSGNDDPDTGAKLLGGKACGGDGGEGDISLGAEDGEDGCRGGGGGGGESYAQMIGLLGCGDGGDGGFGGGGGGSGYDLCDGGDGGFGGGGGGGATYGSTLTGLGPNGGDGGFGGGGGASHNGTLHGPGVGGSFAGNADTQGGGGGAGLGGALFGYQATMTVINSTFTGNSVLRGVEGAPGAQNGTDAGGAIFAVAGSTTILNVTIAGNESTGDGAGVTIYRPDPAQYTGLTLQNTIIANNTPRDECFVLNGLDFQSARNNLITPHASDVHPPCPGVAQTADPELGAFQLNTPGTTKTMAISFTSPALDAGSSLFAPIDDQRGVTRPQGSAVDIGAFELGLQPPQTSIGLTPSSPDGSNDWYVSPVGVTVSAADSDSAVAQTRCDLDPASSPASFADLPDSACAISSVSADGMHDLYAASVDTEGNAEASVVQATFKIDQTDPSLSPTLSSPTVQVGQSGVTALPNASDATSGVASQSCGAVETSTPGDHVVTCSAADKAGNTASVDVHYLVQYRILGYFTPVPLSKWKIGQTVAIKVALGDAAGTRISDAAASALASACRVKFSASGAQSQAAKCMKYSATNDQFVFNWKLGKQGIGDATITVTVTYPGTSSTTQLGEVIVIQR